MTKQAHATLSKTAVFFLVLGLVVLALTGLLAAAQLLLHTPTVEGRLTLALVGLYVFPVCVLILLLSFVLQWKTLAQAWVAAISVTGILCLLAWYNGGQVAPGIVVPLDLIVFVGLFGVAVPLMLLLRGQDEIKSVPGRLGLRKKKPVTFG